jgi:hypothetical protein
MGLKLSVDAGNALENSLSGALEPVRVRSQMAVKPAGNVTQLRRGAT